MSYGIKITKPGYDVNTEADQKNYVVSSDYNHFKIVTAGSGTVTLPDSDPDAQQDTVDVTHSLGYDPVFIGFYNYDYGADDVWLPIPSNAANLTPPFSLAVGFTYPNTNTVRITFDISGLDAALDVPYRYYVFVDSSRYAWS